MPFSLIVSVVPELEASISGDMADSITHEAGGDGWDGDDWVLDAVDI